MRGLLGAIVGGVLGAGLWAALIYFLNLEFGLIAWVVGALVGFVSMAATGKGLQNGIACAVIAALAIFGGKTLGIKAVTGKALAESDAAEMYDSIVVLQDAYEQKVKSPDDHKVFIARQGLFDTENTQQVTSEHLAIFEETYVPALEGQSFHEWVGLNSKGAAESAVKGFKPVDIVFLVLGVLTAFRIGRGSAVGAL